MTTIPSPATIPQPPTWPLLGNLLNIDRHTPAQSLARLARRYGPIYRMTLPGRTFLIVSSRELANEICDETRFDKFLNAGLRQVRPFAGDGLFTAWTHEPNWRKAHNILLPNFGGAAMRGYLPQMIDIAEQLVQKWERLNPDDAIDVAEDMTRLTLDTIGLCGFDYRFNSFYRNDPHPFVGAMLSALGEALLRTNRPWLLDALLFHRRRRLARDVALMNETVDRLIQQRRADPDAMANKRDLLGYMLTGTDRQSGQGLDDLNIRYQILTFLIAGHETTSGLLSFALYYLVKNPALMERARAEADSVLGGDPAVRTTQAQVQRLVYIQQVLKESLRLWPTAPSFTVAAKADTVLAGRYPVRKDEPISLLLLGLHRDPAVWGPDAETFDPERFAPGKEAALPSHAYKPFGNGQRACIGQQFAMQEATLVLGLILRRFEFLDHTNYQLHVKEALTIKPEGFTLRVRLRPLRSGTATTSASPVTAEVEAPAAAGGGTPLLVLYGSNLGTAEGVARRIAEDGRARGFAATVAALDDRVGRLPREGVVVVVCSSYNGTSPDNAGRFCAWLQGDGPTDELRGVRYSVFGCGDHNWMTTFQAIPRRLDERLAARGATCIHPRGEGDAADDFNGQFRAWYGPLWGRIAAALGLEIPAAVPTATPAYRIDPVPADTPLLLGAAAHGAVPMRVVVNRELQAGGSDRSTRHVELTLPDGIAYRAGDHLGVVPRNRPKIVGRVLARFRLDGTARVILRRDGAAKSHLPLDTPVALGEVLAACVELQETTTRDQLETLAARTACPPEKARLLALAANYRDEVFARGLSVLDLLEQFPACELPFAEYLGMLPPLRPRYYSIASSPLLAARVVSLTVGVMSTPARSGRGTFEGIASNYLAEARDGAEVHAYVRSPGTPFRPPEDPRTPMIMVGAGTGLAPFRGFLQERAALQTQGRDVGPALLFFGCRTPECDFLYCDELHEYEARGVVRLVPAFSRAAGQAKVYVQQAVTTRAEAVWPLLERGAIIYVCGDAARMAPAVRDAFGGVYQRKTGGDAATWLGELGRSGRYVEDVWASS